MVRRRRIWYRPAVSFLAILRVRDRLLATTAASVVASLLVATAGVAQRSGGPIASRGAAHFADHTRNLPNEPSTAIAIDPFDDAVVYVGLDGFVFRSDDGGDSWLPVLSFPRGLADDRALDDTAVDAFDGVGNGQAIDPTVGDGALDEGAGAAAQADLEIDELPVGDVTGDDRNNRDDDNDDDLPAGAGDEPAAAGVDDIVDVVDVTVPPRTDPGVRAFAFVPNTKGAMWVATPRGLYRTVTAAASFDHIRLPGGARENDVRDIVVDPVVPSRLWVGTGAGLMRSEDGGASFELVAGRAGQAPTIDLNVDAVAAGEPSHLLVGTERGLLRSRDGGASFTDLLLRGGVAFPTVHSVAWSREGDAIYAGTADGLFVAVRGAAILERYSGMPETPPAAISPDPLWPGGVAVAVRGAAGGVLFSDDNGLTRVDVDVLPAAAPFALARERIDGTRVWVASERGVFRLEPGTGIRMRGNTLSQLRARFEREPDLDVVTAKALLAHGFVRADDDGRGRATIASWLPQIQLRYDGYAGDANQERNTFLFRDPATLPPILDPDFDGNDLFGDGLLIVSPAQPVFHRVFLTLIWDLDRVILNPDVLRSARQMPLLRNAERRVVDRTRQLYVARRRLVAELMTASSSASPRDRVLNELRLQELEAQLTAIANEELFDIDR